MAKNDLDTAFAWCFGVVHILRSAVCILLVTHVMTRPLFDEFMNMSTYELRIGG